jgi:acyl-coenzyme A synthetase/AMP-(fatty) acid ligase
MREALRLLELLKNHDNQISLIENHNSYTYKDLLEQIQHFDSVLVQDQVAPGTITFLKGDYSFQSIAFFLSMFKRGLICVPITTTNEAEIKERIEASGATLCYDMRNDKKETFLPDQVHAIIHAIRQRNRSGLILFSSGSTGKPKAMVHDLDNLVESYLDLKSKSLVFVVFLMFDHIGGLNTLLNCLAMGATIVLPSSRNPEKVSQLIEKYKVNVLPASPTFLNLLLMAKCQETYDLSSLRMITYGTEPMPASLLLKLKDTFLRVKFLQTFGTSETGIIKTQSKSSESTSLKFDDPDQEFQIVNGELWLRSKTQIMGYLNHNMDSFTEDGWFKTGDLVEESEDGFLKITGRAKELINVGGEKVLPAEVESVVMEIDGVTDCIAFGLPNSITGQIVAVNVSLEKGIDPLTIKSVIKKHCSERLDRYKIPAKIQIKEQIDFSDRFKKKRLVV